jgi:hypothetical protein
VQLNPSSWLDDALRIETWCARSESLASRRRTLTAARIGRCPNLHRWRAQNSQCCSTSESALPSTEPLRIGGGGGLEIASTAASTRCASIAPYPPTRRGSSLNPGHHRNRAAVRGRRPRRSPPLRLYFLPRPGPDPASLEGTGGRPRARPVQRSDPHRSPARNIWPALAFLTQGVTTGPARSHPTVLLAAAARRRAEQLAGLREAAGRPANLTARDRESLPADARRRAVRTVEDFGPRETGRPMWSCLIGCDGFTASGWDMKCCRRR